MNAPQKFRTDELAIDFYRQCKPVKLGHAMKDPLMRAATSISLNLMEGSATRSPPGPARAGNLGLASQQ